MLQKLNDLVLLSLLVDCRVHFEMLRMKTIWSLEHTSPFENFFNAVLHQLESPYVYTKLIGAKRPWKISGYLFHGTLFVTEISSWSNFQLVVIKEQAVMPLTQISRNYEFESKILIVLVFLITLALSRLLSREVMLGENIREISLDATWNGGVGRTGRLAPVSLLDTRGGCLWGIVSLANSK